MAYVQGFGHPRWKPRDLSPRDVAGIYDEESRPDFVGPLVQTPLGMTASFEKDDYTIYYIKSRVLEMVIFNWHEGARLRVRAFYIWNGRSSDKRFQNALEHLTWYMRADLSIK